ncbi:MAG: hypothetical protein GY757_45800 [bacterium]|nr:hypothetical protein [bacterium]
MMHQIIKIPDFDSPPPLMERYHRDTTKAEQCLRDNPINRPLFSSNVMGYRSSQECWIS